jgi:site-specific DNA recombinase
MFDSYGRQMGVLRDYRMKTSGRRYYISNQTEWGRRHGVRRMRTNADQLEQLVVATVATFLCDRPRIRALLLGLGVHDRQLERLGVAGARCAKVLQTASNRQVQCALKALIERIELSEQRVKVVIRAPEVKRILGWNGTGLFRGAPDEWHRSRPVELLDVPAGAVRMKRKLALPITPRKPDQLIFPDARLVSLIKRARTAQSLLEENRCEETSILAKRVRCGPTRFARLVRLNYLAPDIIASILDGTQPSDLTRRRLMESDIPMDWSLQRRMLGFPDQPDYLKSLPGY